MKSGSELKKCQQDWLFNYLKAMMIWVAIYSVMAMRSESAKSISIQPPQSFSLAHNPIIMCLGIISESTPTSLPSLQLPHSRNESVSSLWPRLDICVYRACQKAHMGDFSVTFWGQNEGKHWPLINVCTTHE